MTSRLKNEVGIDAELGVETSDEGGEHSGIHPHRWPSADSEGISPEYSRCPYRARASLSGLPRQ